MADRLARALKWCAVLSCAAGLVAACGSSDGTFDNPTDGLDGGYPESGIDFGDGGNANPNGSCKPKTCAEQGIECGPAGDGCGGLIDNCGTCATGTRCGGPGAPSKCVSPTGTDGGVCKAVSCADQGIECGPAGDGCGGILQCGTCGAGQQCGADNAFSKCVSVGPVNADGGVCVPLTCADYNQSGMDCGQQSDGCGGVLDCGKCQAPAFCGGGGPSKCGGGGADGGVCTPKTCADYAAQGINCGKQPDGCGGLTVDCAGAGGCPSPQTCGGGGVASQCGGGSVVGGDGGACVPTTCAAQGKNCGFIADGCGGVIDCGATCKVAGEICGGGGTSNVCGKPTCTPLTQCPSGMNCGTIADGCGGTVVCGPTTCSGGNICGGGGFPNKCGGAVTCTPKTCADYLAQGMNCGKQSDGCGGTLDCGGCQAPAYCGGGGPSKCGGGGTGDGGVCTPKTCNDYLAQGMNCGKQPDGCGNVLDCGGCNAPQTCGGGGKPSVCGGGSVVGADGGACVPTTCAKQGKNCGYIADGCGNVLDCGATCPSGQVCGATTAGVCGKPPCTPLATCPSGMNCGSIADGCGGTITCGTGTCTAPAICGGSGKANQCGGGTVVGADGGTCTPKTCTDLGKNCGQVADGCGGLTADCGTCTSPDICGGGGTPNVCGGGSACTPTTCAAQGKNCGYIADGCGGALYCGTCGNGTVCGGGVNGNGTPNVCSNVDAGTTCTGLCQQVQSCDGGTKTTLTGTVWAPSGPSSSYGALPVPGAIVYIPNGALTPFSTSLTCDQCSAQVSGSPIASTTSAADGTFTLTNVPSGTNIPIVVQLGRWRRKATISNVPSCTTTALNGDLTRLPRNKTEGDIPRIAISTGNVDGLECVLRKMGVDDAEFTKAGGGGRIELYRDNGASPSGSNPLVASDLYTSATELAKHDAVIFGCVGKRVDKNATYQQNVIDYANAGGRVFATHFSYVWLYNISPWQDTAVWGADQASWDAVVGQIDTTPTKRAQFATWLGTVGALKKNKKGVVLSPPRIDITEARHDVDQPVAAGAEKWITTYLDTPDPALLHYAFNTPWNSQPASQCGRVIYSDFHVTGNSSTGSQTFPDECSTSALTSQEKVLAFMLFDLTTCISSDTPPPTTCTPKTCAQQGIACGLAGDGCNGQLDCGQCQNGQTCGGGGVPYQCGGPTCTPKSCADQNAKCGSVPDGCGGTVACGSCPTGQTCGGGGVAYQCGAPSCTPQTCSMQGLACGPAGDGCGGTLDCGTCPSGQTCGGGGVKGQCGAPSCTPKTCAALGANCGDVPDGCGGVLHCGTCAAGKTCGGGGAANVCGSATCTPKTCASLGATCGYASDGCGNVLDCGSTCSGGKVCQNNQCITPSCTPTTCAAAGVKCGGLADGCGNLLNCGTCPSGQTCGGGGVPGQCGAPSCKPLTCAAQGYNCGPAGDGCGNLLNCGTCPSGQTCGGGGTPGQCGAPSCTPITQCPGNMNCGDYPDGCGGKIHCGDCPNGQACGGGGSANVCGAASCSPKTCASMNLQCGPASDGCGNVLDCGNPCASNQLCSQNQCVTPNCTPTTCAAKGVSCGAIADGCGGLLQCGSCQNGQTCGGGGVSGQCGGPTCTPRTCASLGATCGQVADGCGGLTPDCGQCAANQTCNNGVCQTTCVPKTCADVGATCGRVADGCGGLTPDCGTCAAGQTCGGGGVANQCGGTIIR